MAVDLAIVCAKCAYRSPPPYTGVMICTLTKRNVLCQQAKRECPMNYFNQAIEAMLESQGYTGDNYAMDSRGTEGCGC